MYLRLIRLLTYEGTVQNGCRQNIPAQLRLEGNTDSESLKGISNCIINFPADKKVTAIMGMNGSGEVNDHPRPCLLLQTRTVTSKENNRFSDFLLLMRITMAWQWFYCPIFVGTLNNQGNRIFSSLRQHRMTPSHSFIPKSPAGSQFMHVDRSRNPYTRDFRPGTLSDDLAASRHAKYVSHDFGPAPQTKILDSMCGFLRLIIWFDGLYYPKGLHIL